MRTAFLTRAATNMQLIYKIYNWKIGYKDPIEKEVRNCKGNTKANSKPAPDHNHENIIYQPGDKETVLND